MATNGIPAYEVGRVTIIYGVTEDNSLGLNEKTQRVSVRLSDGSDELIDYAMNASAFEQQKLDVGDSVVVAQDPQDPTVYTIIDHFRLPSVGILFAVFLVLAVLFGRMRGITSTLGLAASLAVLAFGMIPAILHGYDPLLVSLIGATVIAVVSILLAHGFNRRSYIALSATILTLILAVAFSFLAVLAAHLSGSGTEEANFLQLGSLPMLNLQGLLLGGMIIGILGVLDDVTTAQVAAVEEIGIADKTLSIKELYIRGLRVGKEHIASLVNTLALAYAGASFPLFLLFAIEGGPPLWVVLNAEYVMEEVVRALVGGASLVIAVPIATGLAAWQFGKRHR